MKEIGETSWIPFFTGGIGNLAGGFLCGWLLRSGIFPQTARRVGVLIFSASMVVAVPAAMVPSPVLPIALISTAIFGYCGALGNVLAIPRDLVAKNAVASIWGLVSMGSGFWWHVLQSGDRMACRLLFVPTRLRVIRFDSDHGQRPDLVAPRSVSPAFRSEA